MARKGGLVRMVQKKIRSEKPTFRVPRIQRKVIRDADGNFVRLVKPGGGNVPGVSGGGK